MALPLPRVVADVGPGGPLVTGLDAINALANNMHLTGINKVKEQYAPLTTQAEAASKLAYANLMAPQFIAKAMNNPAFMANLSNEQRNMLKDLVYGAGTRNQGGNPLNQLPTEQTFNGVGQPSTNSFSGRVKEAFHSLLGKNNTPTNALNINPGQSLNNGQEPRVGAEVYEESPDPEFDRAYAAWQKTPQAQREFSKGEGANIPSAEEVKAWYRNAQGNPMELELKEGQKGARTPSYSENTGTYLGEQKQGEELGKLAAQNINDIGKQQLQLSNNGANIDRLITDFTDPEFMKLRDEFPFLQDTQLKLAAHSGSKAQQEMVGNIIADLEAFKGSTINGFKGQTLKREFEYADKLKPSTTDTVSTALGKLGALKALKEIAWKKNILIKQYMKNDKMDLADAVEKADNKIPIKEIDKHVKELTRPTITLEDENGNRITVTKARARELGVPNA